MAMNLRYETFLPLATQQLRLRNLVRVQGQNIVCSESEKAFIFYTLHFTKNSKAFYESEAITSSRTQLKWAEINSSELRVSNANSVCIKVWAHFGEVNSKTLTTSAFNEKTLPDCLAPSSKPNKLLFTWGVYFSGLTQFNPQNEIKCCPNTLLFQINGDFFGSPEHFTIETLREQLLLNYHQYSASIPKMNSDHSEKNKYCITSPQVSRSSTPDPIDWQEDLLRMSKTRYIQLNFKRKNLRKSYTIEKLLQIQELQRIRMQKKRESSEIESEIKQISVRCISKEQVTRKPRTTSLTSSFLHHSMGRTLSVLLAEQQQVHPKVIFRAQELEKQIETMRCKQRLLLLERDACSDRIAHEKEHLNSITQYRLQVESWLDQQTKQLKIDRRLLNESYQHQLELLKIKRHIMQAVERRMSSLCLELREIYPIERNINGHTICGIAVPNIDMYMNDIKYLNGAGVDSVSPMVLSASLGYIAHLVHMISIIINRPLRNTIICEGSKTRIVDNIKPIPTNIREFPLYSRSAIPSKQVKYAIILLNQNIAQLCYDITGIRVDPRATVENLILIFTTLAEIEQDQRDPNCKTQLQSKDHLTLPTKYKNNIVGVQGDSVDCLSKSYSSMDMNHVPIENVGALLQLARSDPVPIMQNSSIQHRISRSVGSYSDCDDNIPETTIGHFHSNSDFNIPTFKRREV